jgi:hypothetical protein
VVCRRELGVITPALVHHVQGCELGSCAGKKSRDRDAIPLCARHHDASYSTGYHFAPETWERIHGTQAELLDWDRSQRERP